MSEFLEFVKETLDKKVPAKIPIKRLYITDCIDYENIEDFLIFLHLFMHVNDINLFQFRDKIISTLENKSNDYSNKRDRYSCFSRTHQLAKLCGSTSRQVEDVFINDFCQKIARIENLLQNNIDPKNESLIDSFIDLINYRLLFEGYKIGLQ